MVDKHRVRTLAVGDIHGCLSSLKTLMQFVGLTSSDRLVLLGDYVDRGPDSKGVIDWILKHQRSHEVIPLRGNHEVLMMDARNDLGKLELWTSVGGEEALQSYGVDGTDYWARSIPKAHWEFIEQTPLHFETERHIYVHGMVNADRDMDEQDPYLMVWARCFGMRPHHSGRKVICGHTAHKDGEIGVYDFGYCIDTAACKGGWLTCLNAETGEFWQANEAGETRSGNVDP